MKKPEVISRRKLTKKEIELHDWIENDLEEREKRGEIIGSESLHPKATEIDKIKWNICKQVVIASRVLGISNQELGEKMGLDKSKTSLVLHYRIKHFTIDRLLGSFLKLEGLHKDIDAKINEVKNLFSKAA
jgi:hypothetical protein